MCTQTANKETHTHTHTHTNAVRRSPDLLYAPGFAAAGLRADQDRTAVELTEKPTCGLLGEWTSQIPHALHSPDKDCRERVSSGLEAQLRRVCACVK